MANTFGDNPFWFERFFPNNLTSLIPEAKTENFEISTIEMDAERVRFEKMKSAFDGHYKETYALRAGKYVRLISKKADQIMMSNTPMEMETQVDFVRSAKGKVFIAGLGIGMVTLAIQDNPEVTEITILEKEQEVIDLVAKHLPFNKKVKIVQGDAFTFKTPEQFDILYFDIWNTISADNYREMKALTKLYRKNKVKGGAIIHWRQSDCRKLAREDAKGNWRF